MRIFLETYTSINDDTIRIINKNAENNVCLNISNFIFSLRLSFIIELCNLFPLTASAIMQGIKKMFCSKIVDIKNNIPLPIPHVSIIDDIVYPKQNPLKHIVKYTIDIPITVEPINHKKTASTQFLLIESFNNANSFILLSSFKLLINEDI